MERNRIHINVLLLLAVLVVLDISSPDNIESSPEKTHRKATAEQPFPKDTIYILGHPGVPSGMGSQLMNMLSHKLLFNDMGRNFIVDTSAYSYRWNDTVGLLTGYFTPEFQVIDNKNQHPNIKKEYNLEHYPKLSSFEEIINTSHPVLVTALRAPTRKFISNQYDTRSLEFYNRMAREACVHLQFNAQTLKEIERVKAQNQIPDFLQGTTVAFHVRRGDKLRGESKLYEGSKYVEKLLSITSKHVDHCFVASGDYAAVEEVAKALHDHHVNCTIHTLTSQSEHGAYGSYLNSNKESTIAFLSEMSLLVDATYFIGTFNSNVGALVSLKRKCVHQDALHYANSYGVDTDNWYIIGL